MQVSPAGQSDDTVRFLAEFRALRDRAALDYEELTARTHYPSDVLKDAENGPGLPGLPVLAAYVRACGGDVTEWEERWQRLVRSAEDEAGLPTRPAGASAAAVAGARAGVTVGPADAPDTERIKAALRAHRQREEEARVADVGFSGRSAAAQTTLVANGAHHKEPRGGKFDSSVTSATASASATAASAAAAGLSPQAPAAEAGEGFRAFSGSSRSPGASGASRAGGAGATGRERATSSSAAGPDLSTRVTKVLEQSKGLQNRPRVLAALVAAVLILCIVVLALS